MKKKSVSSPVDDTDESDEDRPLVSADHPRNCSHIPKVKNWREVIEHWTKGSPQKNLTVPLKDWPAGTRTKKSLKFKYHDRKLIAWEY